MEDGYIEGSTPPAGEAGMCRVNNGEWFKYWNSEQWFDGEQRADAAVLAFERGHVYAGGIRNWRWATVREMRDGQCSEEQILRYHHELGREQECAPSSAPATVSRALTDLRENSDMILRDTRGLLASTRQRIERRPVVAAPREHDPREGLLVEPTPITIRQQRIMWGL